MKHVNMIGGTLAAVLAIGVITACDGRGVTAMKSRRFSVEEQALAKAMEGKSQPTAAKNSPDAGPAKTEVPGDENEGHEAIGEAQTKLFNEKGGVVSASRSDILARAEEQLGIPNGNARKFINGLSIWDKSEGAKWKINVEAVIMMNGVEKTMFLSGIEVSSVQTDVVGGLSGVELKDRLDSNAVSTVESDKLVVSTVCKEIKDDACQKAILVIQWNFKAGGAQFVLVEFDRTQNGKITGATNVGDLPSFDEANNKKETIGSKPTATLEDIRREGSAPKAAIVGTKHDLGAISRGSRTGDVSQPFEFRPAAKPAPKVEAPKVAAPKADAPKVDAPKVDAPKADAPKADAPKADAPKASPVVSLSKPAAESNYVSPYTPSKTEVKTRNVTYAEYAARAKAERAARPVPLPTQKSLRYNHRVNAPNQAPSVPKAAALDAKSQDVAASAAPAKGQSNSWLANFARAIGTGL